MKERSNGAVVTHIYGQTYNVKCKRDILNSCGIDRLWQIGASEGNAYVNVMPAQDERETERDRERERQRATQEPPKSVPVPLFLSGMKVW